MEKQYYVFLLFLFFFPKAYGELCSPMFKAKKIATFDKKLNNEISGISYSNTYTNRIYIHNDSGSDASFFVTDTRVRVNNKVKIYGYYAVDFEDMDVGPCGKEDCLFIGDIGDNGHRRDFLNIIVIKEKYRFPKILRPFKNIKVRYADGKSHNAESLSIHPGTGDLYILTKSGSELPKLFTLPHSTWIKADTKKIYPLTLVGDIDLSKIFKNAPKKITSMDISPNGKKFIVLNYNNAFEFNLDLASVNSLSTHYLLENTIHKKVDLKRLIQQEAITYTPSGDLLYTTERVGFLAKPHLYKVFCHPEEN